MRKILLLEDDLREQEMINSVISGIDSQTELIRCTDVKEAYTQALEGSIDLFIVDVILKPERHEDTSGLRFIESIRGVMRYEFTPVIILTCLEDLKSYSYESLHCYAFIEKPFRADILRQSVEACLRSPRSPEKYRTLYYRKDGAILAIPRDEIIYAVSMFHQIHIYTTKNDCIAVPYLTVRQFLSDVSSPDFIQCSRNTVINKNYATRIDISKRQILLYDEKYTADIGGRYMAYVKEAFGSGKNE